MAIGIDVNLPDPPSSPAPPPAAANIATVSGVSFLDIRLVDNFVISLNTQFLPL
jgi:hypothetical protein